jgi:hypothetical protein
VAHPLLGNVHIQELPFLPSGAMAYVSGIEAPFQDELGRSTPGPGEDQVPLAGFVNNKAGSARKIECVAASLICMRRLIGAARIGARAYL